MFLFWRNAVLTALAALVGCHSAPLRAEETTRPLNVLFIAVDDLRPLMKCYGDPLAVTPNMDKLANSGYTFKRAYCQQAVCAPSRASILTGTRPDTTRVFDLKTHFRTALPDVVTLPQHFKQNGYQARSVGKIYHSGLDDPPSWSAPPFEETTSNTALLRDIAETGNGRQAITVGNTDPRAHSWAMSDQPDEALRDGQVATGAIELMREMKDQPFFLAAGFIKPHLPFIAPKKYFDLYPPEKIKLPEPAQRPRGAPDIAFHNFGELRTYKDIPSTGPVSEQQILDLIRAYYASMSYADAQIGRVLDELDRLGLRERTIVVLWGDHGYHLGEHGQWNKHTNFELATHVPLIFRSPNQGAATMSTDRLVELVDVYPTLCDLAGLGKPSTLEGTSLAPFIQHDKLPRKQAVFSQYPRRNTMGYSVRTDHVRYTEWRKPDGDVVERELYVYKPGPFFGSKAGIETENLADQPGKERLQRFMSTLLQRGWRGAHDWIQSVPGP